MATIIIIGLIIAFIFILIFFISAYFTKRRIVQHFKENNVIVFGKKGCGKDLIFQAVIAKRKAPYYANINYGGKYTEVKANDFNLSPNTYKQFIEGNITILKKKYNEDNDWYFSDGGIILPSQYDSQLHKLYPSFPIFYALSRHTLNANVHINAQNVERIWKALREQADYYIKACKRIKLPFMILVKVREYDRYQSACQDIRPIKQRLLNKYTKGDQDTYQASNGEIKEGWLIVWKKSIKYDTRAYHEKIYGYKAPKKPSIWQIIKSKLQKKKAD